MKSAALVAASLFLSAAVMAQAPVIDVNSSDLEARLSAIERIVDSRTQSQHRIQAQLDNMQSEIDQLRGAVEVHTNQLEKVLQRQRELYLEIDKRVEALKGAAASVPNSPPTAGTGNVGQSPSSVQPPSSDSEAEAYEAAVNLILRDRDYDKAVPAFREFIRQYPDSQYAANAYYWLGQLLFNQQNWQEAKIQFETVVQRYTDSTKRADSLLKLGIIAERLGNGALAAQMFNRVVTEYPDSSARKLAENRLTQTGG
ncbi:tol-pal system protein YbgF [Alteromonas oceanisediminis]|uniref:tol-pal system protein YbgF n=1 Tax=Alteromonas oceanisediminis TaxID=2836180 RepID=UPI001BDB13FE|nr:tol-pal system protein YbgF [Alteromonas oceanisediminis]MBT0587566.1 tol-pal system protein YbgF [Alteromonas oceanisediminis]